MPPSNPFCGIELGGTPAAANPRQAVTGCPSFISVAPMIPAELATAPPQYTPDWSVHFPPEAGAVNVLIPFAGEPGLIAPAAKRRRLRSGATSSARPPLPSNPVATVEVPVDRPAGERRVPMDEVGETPWFQITWSTPSPVRPSPSCSPGWVEPLILAQEVRAGPAGPAAAAVTAPAATVASAARRVSVWLVRIAPP